jgi:CBS domain-containing protein
LIKINIIQPATFTIANAVQPIVAKGHANSGGERVMFELLVKDVMEQENALVVAPETTVAAAAELMAQKKTGAVMVTEHGQLVGIFTERDALFRVIARGLDARTTQLAEVMTANPQSVGPRTSYGYALIMMQENGFRNTPVVENGKPIGIVTSRSAMDPDLEEFVSEANRRAYIRVNQ